MLMKSLIMGIVERQLKSGICKYLGVILFHPLLTALMQTQCDRVQGYSKWVSSSMKRTPILTGGIRRVDAVTGERCAEETLRRLAADASRDGKDVQAVGRSLFGEDDVRFFIRIHKRRNLTGILILCDRAQQSLKEKSLEQHREMFHPCKREMRDDADHLEVSCFVSH